MTADVPFFGEEIRIPEEIYSEFHHVMVLSPGRDGEYGATTRTGGELFDAMQDYIALEVEYGCFLGTLDTTDAVPGSYVMRAEDIDGNIDLETFELLASVPTSTEQGIGGFKTKERGEEKIYFDMPRCVAIGEPVDVRGTTTASGNLDIVIDDILMADDLTIDSWNEFEGEWNTRKPLPNMDAYTPGSSVIKAYVNCHAAGVRADDYVRTDYNDPNPLLSNKYMT